jgi:hypothetical protein
VPSGEVVVAVAESEPKGTSDTMDLVNVDRLRQSLIDASGSYEVLVFVGHADAVEPLVCNLLHAVTVESENTVVLHVDPVRSETGDISR